MYQENIFWYTSVVGQLIYVRNEEIGQKGHLNFEWLPNFVSM